LQLGISDLQNDALFDPIRVRLSIPPSSYVSGLV